MEKTRGYDKYYHAKANCEAAKRGATGEAIAYLISYGKEVKDLLYKVIVLKWDFDEVVKDCLEDIEADKYGIEKSRKEGSCGDLVKDVRDLYKK